MKTHLVTLLIAGLGAFAFAPAVAQANRADEAQQRLEAVQSDIRELQTTLRGQRTRADTQQTVLRRIETEIGEVADQLRTAHARLKKTRTRLNNLHERRGQLRSELTDQRSALAQQMRGAYMAGREQKLKLLLNQQHPEKIDRMLVYYDYLNNTRRQHIQAARRSLAQLRSVNQQIGVQMHKLGKVKHQLAAKQDKLEQRRGQRQEILAGLKHRITSTDQSLAARRQEEAELHRLIESIRNALADIPDRASQGAPFTERKGKLPWPAAGPTQASPQEASAAGVIIDAASGAPVHAIAGGRVAFAEWMRGFGLLIIIDHGEGYMSLYGHNQSLFKATGDWVGAGELIGRVGDSGGHAQAGLYFAIRHQGKPVRPSTWCSKDVRIAGEGNT